MQTEAIFENIAERIVLELGKAQNSIFIAVAWFTNMKIFNILQQKAEEGCQINLMYSDDHINENSQIDFELIKNANVFPIGDGDQNLMHNKFCVIDYCTVITGSYNWSNKAESNYENITITEGDTSLAEQFVSEFNKIRQMYYPEIKSQKVTFPITQIIKRLEIIKNFIILEELDELSVSVLKLKVYDFNSDIYEIIDFIQKKDFGDAIRKIEIFINQNQQLSIWIDPEINALKLEIKNIENQINAFDNEKTELEKILGDFQYQHSIELGEIILEILKLRTLKFKNTEKFEEAKKDEEKYQYQIEEEKDKKELDDKQKKELKKIFRKATLLCHPDKFSNESIEIQKQAEALFKELNEANFKNDLVKVSEILENLEKGILLIEKSNSISDKEILRATINKLKQKLKKLEAEILAIKQSDTFKMVTSIKDWNLYFKQTKDKLKLELEELRTETTYLRNED